MVSVKIESTRRCRSTRDTLISHQPKINGFLAGAGDVQDLPVAAFKRVNNRFISFDDTQVKVELQSEVFSHVNEEPRWQLGYTRNWSMMAFVTCDYSLHL